MRYNYKTQPDEDYLGFIAEDVPEIVAMADRKSLATMDIVTLLTKVVQEQSKAIQEQNKIIAKLTAKVSGLEKILND